MRSLGDAAENYKIGAQLHFLRALPGLSDHHLLTWSVSTPRSQQQQQLQEVVYSGPWRSLDVEQLRAELAASPLYQAN